MKITVKECAFNAKSMRLFIDETKYELPFAFGNLVISNELQMYNLVNKWNKQGQYNAQVGLPIYIYTIEKVEK